MLPHFVFHSEMSRLEGSKIEIQGSKARRLKARNIRLEGSRLEIQGSKARGSRLEGSRLEGSTYRILLSNRLANCRNYSGLAACRKLIKKYKVFAISFCRNMTMWPYNYEYVRGAVNIAILIHVLFYGMQ